MTYRQDSDFPHPYGHIIQLKNHSTNQNVLSNYITYFGKEYSGMAKGKSKAIAWFVSNCDSMSRREEYVKELQKLIQVNLFKL